jgi:hypothetical protein
MWARGGEKKRLGQTHYYYTHHTRSMKEGIGKTTPLSV